MTEAEIAALEIEKRKAAVDEPVTVNADGMYGPPPAPKPDRRSKRWTKARRARQAAAMRKFWQARKRR